MCVSCHAGPGQLGTLSPRPSTTLLITSAEDIRENTAKNARAYPAAAFAVGGALSAAKEAAILVVATAAEA